MLPAAILLGPQRHVPLVRPAVEYLVGPGRQPVALVTAGWEERELEDTEFREHMQRPVVNLEIWARVERIFERDPELLLAMRDRHDALRAVQELYRLRLTGLVAAAAALLRRDGEARLLDPERQGAIAMLQQLDASHLQRTAAIHAEFQARFHPRERAAVRREQADLQSKLDETACLCIAGGHVGMLLHRLSLFDLMGLWGKRPVVAWSAGAMVLCERIVLFHEDRSQANPDTEVMEAGLGLVPGLVPLPHAKKRLDLTSAHTVALLARRFDPSLCVVLDDGHRIDWNGKHWSAQKGTRRLHQNGELAAVTA